MNKQTLSSKIFSVTCLILLFISPNLNAQQSGAGEAVMYPIISEIDIPVISIAPRASDGFKGEAFLRKPPGHGPFPAIVLIHGGGPRWPTTQLRDYAVHIHASRFLEAGYVVVSITRRDLSFNLEEGEEQEPVIDSVAIINYVKDLPYVDPESVVARGTSVGGYLTLEVGAASDLAAITVEEPFSMPFVGAGVLPDSDVVLNTEKIDQLNIPVLLIRGDQTPNINDFNRDFFIPAMRSANKPLKVLTYPGELHSFAFYDSAERTLRPAVALEAFEEIDAFFRENLRTQPKPLDSSIVQHRTIESN